MSVRRVGHFAAVVLSLAAAVVSYELLLKHVTGSSGVRWFEAGCSDNAAPGGANCAAVLASPYSYFPPKKSKEPDGRLRLPAAFLGLVYYSTLAVWLLGVGRPSPRRRWLHAVVLLFIGVGLAMSAYYTTIMFRVLDQWCMWCMVTHGLNLLIAICAMLMWPGRPATLDRTLQKGASPPPAVDSAVLSLYPSARVLFVTLLAIAAVALAELNLLGVKTWKRQAVAAGENYNTCIAAVTRLKGDADLLFRHWQSAAYRDIAIRPDDPTRSGPDAQLDQPTLDVVVFSDFECPSCARFAAFLEEQAQPLFAGQIKLIFKHYPIDRACNERVSQTVHKHACEGVTLVEGARLLGGNEAFWRAHDYVYKNRDALAVGTLTPQALAEAVDLSASALVTAMQSEEVLRRVAEDIEQAKLADIRGTPAVFVEGKLVDMLAVTEIGFWDKVAEMYWQRSGLPRPESTRVKKKPTPDTPSRKDAS